MIQALNINHKREFLGLLLAVFGVAAVFNNSAMASFICFVFGSISFYFLTTRRQWAMGNPQRGFVYKFASYVGGFILAVLFTSSMILIAIQADNTALSSISWIIIFIGITFIITIMLASDKGVGLKIMKVTIDTNAFNIIDNPRLDPIFKLADAGKITIFYVDALVFEVLKGKIQVEDLPKKQQENARKRLEKAKKYNLIKSWQTFKHHYDGFPMRFVDKKKREELADILFPTRKSGGKYDEEDVRQLYAHYSEHNDIFVTGNVKDFINGGKREKLKQLGIIVMTPDEFLSI